MSCCRTDDVKSHGCAEGGFSAEAWKLENGQYVDASGIPIAGALEKGITVSKYQNRQNGLTGGIDWKKVAQDGISFAWCGSVILMTWILIIP